MTQVQRITSRQDTIARRVDASLRAPRRLIASLICSLCIGPAWATGAAAADGALRGAEIRSLITGRTVTLQTPVGQIPLRYDASGAVSGDLAGVSAVTRLFAPRETGSWWIKGDAMCQQWPTWYDGKRFCFRIEKQADDLIRWRRDDGAVGVAIVR